jgi:hypothetical protein
MDSPENPMLTELYPQAYPRYLALPLLGSVVDEFDNWLVAQGYRRNTRQPYIHQIATMDAHLRTQGRGPLAELMHDDLQRCWQWYHPRNPHSAGSVRLLEQFLDHTRAFGGAHGSEYRTYKRAVRPAAWPPRVGRSLRSTVAATCQSPRRGLPALLSIRSRLR